MTGNGERLSYKRRGADLYVFFDIYKSPDGTQCNNSAQRVRQFVNCLGVEIAPLDLVEYLPSLDQHARLSESLHVQPAPKNVQAGRSPEVLSEQVHASHAAQEVVGEHLQRMMGLPVALCTNKFPAMYHMVFTSTSHF